MTEHHSGLYRAVSLPCSSVLLWRIWLFLRHLANLSRGKCRHGGRGCCLSPLRPACPDHLGTSLGSPSRAQHQSLPKGHRFVSLAQPYEGDCSWLSRLIMWNKLFELCVPWGRAWWSFLLFSFCTKWYREAMRLRLSAQKHALELTWVWMGQGRCLGSTGFCRGICNQRDLTELWLLRSALNCDSDCGTITSYQMNQQERSLSLAEGYLV